MPLTTFDELMALSLWGTPADNGTTGRIGAGLDTTRAVIEAIGRALPHVGVREQAQLRHRLGYIALILGDVRTKAIEAFTMMLDSALVLHDQQLEGMARNGLACVYDLIGQRHLSLQYAEDAERLAVTAGDRRLQALALNNQAQFYKETGQNPRAFELYKRIEAIGHELDQGRLLIMAYVGMGRTTSMAEPFTAIAHYEQAIAMAQSLGDQIALMVCYNNLSDWMINTGRYAEAITLREDCLRLAQKLHSRIGIGRALIGIAKARTLMGDLGEARALLDKGLPTVLSAGDLEGDLHSSLNLAYLYARSGDIPRACDLYRQTLERSLAAPDTACAVFAQQALELLADGEVPLPAILPSSPVTDDLIAELSDDELEGVVGGVTMATLRSTYPTGDLNWMTQP